MEWDGDNGLYKATVKKVFFDRENPMLKIHYDGKKRHILDTIPIEMVNSFIDGENDAINQPNHATEDAEGNAPTHDERADFPPLHKLYPGHAPVDGNDATQPCPELGPGWQVNVVTRKGGSADGEPRSDRYFISPTGQKFRSIPEVERYYWQNPVQFGGAPGDATKFESNDERLDEECHELALINQALIASQSGGELSEFNLDAGNRLGVKTDNVPALPPDFSPIYAQRGSKSSGMRSLITISPITTGQPNEVDKANAEPLPEQKMSRLSSILQGQESVTLNCLKPPAIEALALRTGARSPNEVDALNTLPAGRQLPAKNGERSTSAFASPGRAFPPPLHHQLYQTSSTAPNRSYFPGMRSASLVRLQTKLRADHTSSKRARAEASEDAGRTRPKRKLKPVARLEEEDVTSKEVPKVLSKGSSKSVLCHCPEGCEKGRDLTVQGIYAHYGRAHKGKLPWASVTYSCPFCPPTKAKLFGTFHDAEAHVASSHPGCEVVGPHPSKLTEQSAHAQHVAAGAGSRQDTVAKNDRVLRERKAVDALHEDAPPEAVVEDQGPPSWTKLEYAQLLTDGRKDYPRDLPRVIDMIDEQCQAQEEAVNVALEQRMKQCKSEAEAETRAFDEERVLYQRGLRERARFADAERIEKHRYTERAEEIMIRHEYENRNRGKNQEDVEVEKLCTRPVKFGTESQRHHTRHGTACKDEQCQFCMKEKGYLHHLLLDSEIGEFKMDAPTSECHLFQKSTKVLNPTFRMINDDYLMEADAESDIKEKVNQSRRDATTSKRLKTEEEKLLVLRNTKHSLEFIQRYNDGMIKNAWGDVKKDGRGRRSF